MDMTDEERAALVELRIEKAVRAYEQAKGVVELKYWETVANRLYYSAYNAVSAVLIANGDTAQTHSGVMHIFGLRFVKTGIVTAETGRLYHALFTIRQTGDYDDTYSLNEEDVMPHIVPTGKLVDSLASLARQILAKSHQS